MAQKAFTLNSRIKLANGRSMPQIHLGVYLTSGHETVNAVTWALEAGYRAIDSAQMYHNEREVGSAIRQFLSGTSNTSSLQREDIHFTSKLASNTSYDAARKAIKQSITHSGLDYIDLFLLHSPYGGKAKRLECWRAVEDAIEDGEVKIGGVSNFGVKHLQELLASKPRTHPVVNQIEVHPFNPRTEITSFCQQHDIVVEAYAPLARALRISIPPSHGFVPLPKSVTRSRIIENGNMGGCAIEPADMKTMDGLDEYLVTDWDPVDCD